MRTFAVRAGYIPTDKLETFERMVADVEAMPDLEPAERVSCHAVCRALAARHPGATCVDGWFAGTGQEHSWLDLGDGIIADMYPVATSGPFLVDASHWMVPWNRLYTAKPDLLDGPRGERARHDEVAQLLVEALAESDRQP